MVKNVFSGGYSAPVWPEIPEKELKKIRNDPKYKEMLKKWDELENERAKN